MSFSARLFDTADGFLIIFTGNLKQIYGSSSLDSSHPLKKNGVLLVKQMLGKFIQLRLRLNWVGLSVVIGHLVHLIVILAGLL